MVRVYNGSGCLGKNVMRDVYKGKSVILLRGIDSVIIVLGMVDSWDVVLKKYGCMFFVDVLEFVCDYVENGFLVLVD